MGLATLPHYCQFILNSVIGGVDRVDSDGMYSRQGNNSFEAVTVEIVLQSTISGDDTTWSERIVAAIHFVLWDRMWTQDEEVPLLLE